MKPEKVPAERLDLAYHAYVSRRRSIYAPAKTVADRRHRIMVCINAQRMEHGRGP